VPERERELAAARDQVHRLAAEHTALYERLTKVPKGVAVPGWLWEKANALDEQKKAAESIIARLEVQIAETHSNRLSVEVYQSVLKRFTEVFGELDALRKSDLLAYLLDEVAITGTEMRIALLGDPEAGRLVNFGGDQLGQPLEWLPERRRSASHYRQEWSAS
jgi:hypothetical protein